jgi:hypothetical protein
VPGRANPYKAVMGVPSLVLANGMPELERAKAKTRGRQGQLPCIPVAPPRRIPKRLASLVLLRPTTEWGAVVWRLHRSDMSRLDSLQADLVKPCFHCPASICHKALRPMSITRCGTATHVPFKVGSGNQGGHAGGAPAAKAGSGSSRGGPVRQVGGGARAWARRIGTRRGCPRGPP